MKINLTGDKRSFLGFLSNLKINKITPKSKKIHPKAMASSVGRLGKDTRRHSHTLIDAWGCFNKNAHYYTNRTCGHMKTHGQTRTYIYVKTTNPHR